MESDEERRIIDEEHLRLLSLFHYISGGITLVLATFAFIPFVIMRLVFSQMDPSQFEGPGPDPQMMVSGLFSVYIGFTVLGILFGAAKLVSAWVLRRKQWRLFSMVVAVPSLLFIPYGTILGIMTFIVLSRPSVGMLYEEARSRPSM